MRLFWVGRKSLVGVAEVHLRMAWCELTASSSALWAGCRWRCPRICLLHRGQQLGLDGRLVAGDGCQRDGTAAGIRQRRARGDCGVLLSDAQEDRRPRPSGAVGPIVRQAEAGHPTFEAAYVRGVADGSLRHVTDFRVVFLAVVHGLIGASQHPVPFHDAAGDADVPDCTIAVAVVEMALAYLDAQPCQVRREAPGIAKYSASDPRATANLAIPTTRDYAAFNSVAI